ncbi:MAG: 2-pyrone-4,6-dicarboxylate hydrolase [Rhodovulum sulfidophilum]|uniref:2-pyrone-4,6-dicarboxylate hydrolase n=1 Tax=Rhodovulum sulfidophilum TaxID=35806 RepID=A0A2W5MZB3_RHOSU|nr:MAG: 2-pyrone-4,6-dicarboxylate hydrolase [Rhodovulum sulfidophilum]
MAVGIGRTPPPVRAARRRWSAELKESNVSLDVETQAYVTGETLEAPNSIGTEPPRTRVPLGAVDAHHHIYDPRFLETDGTVRPVGTVAQYSLLKRRLGITRSVVVAPNSYNRDNDCLVDALGQLGDDARGVAIVQPDVTDAELRALHGLGVRGIRLYFGKNVWTAEQTGAVAGRLADMGWHIEYQPGHADRVAEAEEMLNALPCRVVLDHFAYIPQPEGFAHPSAAAVFRLLENGRTYVKLSGNYFTSEEGFPDYSDLNDVGRRFVAARPDRMLWGTDWPHTRKVYPDDARLFDQVSVWAPREEDRLRVLVENPDELYWYS